MEFCIYHERDLYKEFDIDDRFRPILEELTTYIIRGQDIEEVPGILRRKVEDIAELNFGNYIGLASICNKDFIVKSKKISEEQFNEILAQITEEIANLPFDFNNPTFLPFERSSPSYKDILYQRFAYLRHIVLHRSPNLEAEFRVIEANPHRSTLRTLCNDDISRFRGSNPASILGSYARGENLHILEPGNIAYRYPLALGIAGVLEKKVAPRLICDERVEAILDNPENRFIKDFLKSSLLVAEHFYQALRVFFADKGIIDISRGVVDDCQKIIKTLEKMLRTGFLTEVGEMNCFPSNSQVLQKREGYRQLFMHYFKMSLASQFPIDNNTLKQIIESKDIATLYEYWCFFTMARILRERLGRPSSASIEKQGEFRKELKYGISINYSGGISLSFNKPYGGNSASSYSVSLRPDISLRRGGDLHLFDAKFKYVNVEFDEQEALDNIEREEEMRQEFKRGDLYKMHTYRDAIMDARDVWILYPGTEFIFYELSKGKCRSIEDIDILDGVGAIPLKPLGDTKDLERTLDRILEREV